MSMEDVMLVPISFAVILGVFAVVSIIVLYIRGHRDRGDDVLGEFLASTKVLPDQ